MVLFQWFCNRFEGKGNSAMGDLKMGYESGVSPMTFGSMGKDELDEVAKKLNAQIDRSSAILSETPYFSEADQDKLFLQLMKAKNAIDKHLDHEDRVIALTQAIFEIHRVDARIAEKREFLRQNNHLQLFVPVLAVVYLLLIIAGTYWGWNLDIETIKMPVLGIPFVVLIWSAVGSFAAILYRFYMNRLSALGQVGDEIRWLIARPAIGIVMGMFSYLIIFTGLFVFGSTTQSDEEIVRPEILWVAAFLSGFSDRFFQRFIDMLTYNSSSPNQDR